MEIGIVGLPNVGKSTLFNALTKAGATSSNYPFTTIEPNVGVVAVPDERLDFLFGIFKPPKKTPSFIKFVDIAGLVKGASGGEGLGNKFLANIREVDAILHVVRAFDDKDVVHVAGETNPLRDIGTIETELMLADLESVGKMIEKNSGAARTGDKAAREKTEKLLKIKNFLSEGRPASACGFKKEEMKEFNLLTAKPVLYTLNSSEKPDRAPSRELENFARKRKAGFVEISAKLQSELADLEENERKAFLRDMGEERSGLEKVILESKKLLNLVSFFTKEQKVEVRSWTVPTGTKAPRAAGKIHGDFEKGFIKAEVYSFADIKKHRDEKVLREKGLVRSEGKDYEIKDGDICFFRFNV